MPSAAPSFRLPPCPVCSNLLVLDRPIWRFAHNTSRKLGTNAYIFSGCKHSAEVGSPDKIRSDPDEWALIEDAWAARAEQLFAAKTEGWKPEQADNFRRALSDKIQLPKEVVTP